MQLSKNGIIDKVQKAKEESIKEQIREEIQLELIGIITECISKTQEITNEVIQQKLKEKLSGIEVLEDLTGSYKGYEYEIDENFNVHIVGKRSDEIKIKVDKKVGTSYVTIEVQAMSTSGNIVQYEYIVNGIKYESDKNTYTIENLEPESNHTIKIIVIDGKQNIKESWEYKIRTEARTYLYKEGNEYINITGGWIAAIRSGDGALTKTDQDMTYTCSYVTSYFNGDRGAVSCTVYEIWLKK